MCLGGLWDEGGRCEGVGGVVFDNIHIYHLALFDKTTRMTHLKITGFLYAQVPFKTEFTVQVAGSFTVFIVLSREMLKLCYKYATVSSMILNFSLTIVRYFMFLFSQSRGKPR
jgi:hypothetical protein